MNAFHIHIKGRVQGVGFRPFVYNLAREFGLCGWVNNTLDGVHVEFNAADETEAKQFCSLLVDKAPALSVITSINLSKVAAKEYHSFSIQQSNPQGEANLLLSPDFGICPDCREDIYQSGNRRQHYAFTTCTNCGPRYSITTHLPYDRHTTAMQEFSMCPACQIEFNQAQDRRYYSQTNSCPICQITLSLYNRQGSKCELGQEEILEQVSLLWKEGKIIALKGIGGYLLCCDAQNQAAIIELRKRKHRPSKPFALMFPNLQKLNRVIELKDKEREALLSPESPIVLLRLNKNEQSGLAIHEIAPGIDQIGVMLPYTPLYDLLLKKFDRPIVATSGNVSNAAIVYQDEKALQDLSEIADYILANDRQIVVPQDDSVVKFCPGTSRQIVIRRSRGLAPSYLNRGLQYPDKTIMATGADLKSTFTLCHQNNCYTSQYIGDLENFDSQQSYQSLQDHYFKLFQCRPEIILCDRHPEYFSTQLARSLSNKYSIPLHSFQHHIAHFAAVLGENHLIDSTLPVLGVLWDGTGYGLDGQIWGGEFFTYQDYQFNRAAHLSYFPSILGNKMAREPRISALASCASVSGTEDLLRPKFSKEEWKIYQALLQKDTSLKTSSLGRIFDAGASLLGLIDRSSFEGEAAMLLENLAWRYIESEGMDFDQSYLNLNPPFSVVPVQPLMEGIILDINEGVHKAEIAAKFHYSLVDLVSQMAAQFGTKDLAFSGGVFQNSLLIDMLHHYLGKDYRLHFHQMLSPNDENISFGQLIAYQIMLKNSYISDYSTKSETHVSGNTR